MMKLAWLAMAGISLQMGVGLARYWALRAHRRGAEVDRRSPTGVSPLVDRSATALVCRWTVVRTRAGALDGDQSSLVCHWTHQGSAPAHRQPAISSLDRRRVPGQPDPVAKVHATMKKDRRRWIS